MTDDRHLSLMLQLELGLSLAIYLTQLPLCCGWSWKVDLLSRWLCTNKQKSCSKANSNSNPVWGGFEPFRALFGHFWGCIKFINWFWALGLLMQCNNFTFLCLVSSMHKKLLRVGGCKWLGLGLSLAIDTFDTNQFSPLTRIIQHDLVQHNLILLTHSVHIQHNH